MFSFDGGVKVFNIKIYEAFVGFIFYEIEPLNDFCGIFPLGEVAIISYTGIDTTDPINLINNEAALILSHSNTKNRKIRKYQKADAFLTIKDHKPNFPYS